MEFIPTISGLNLSKTFFKAGKTRWRRNTKSKTFIMLSSGFRFAAIETNPKLGRLAAIENPMKVSGIETNNTRVGGNAIQYTYDIRPKH